MPDIELRVKQHPSADLQVIAVFKDEVYAQLEADVLASVEGMRSYHYADWESKAVGNLVIEPSKVRWMKAFAETESQKIEQMLREL